MATAVHGQKTLGIENFGIHQKQPIKIGEENHNVSSLRKPGQAQEEQKHRVETSLHPEQDVRRGKIH